MGFAKKYLVFISGLSLCIVELFSRYIGGTTSVTILIILATCIFYCLQNQDKNYISKALNCFKVTVLAILLCFVMSLLINPFLSFDFTSTSYINTLAEKHPKTISRLIISVIIALPFAFVVPIFFKTKVVDREDVLDM